MHSLSVCCLQPLLQDTVAECCKRVERLLITAKDQGSSLVILPERWLPFSLGPDTAKYVFEPNQESLQFLQDCAKKYSLCVVSGGLWEYVHGHPKIVCYVIDHTGTIVGRQEKLHLYALEKHFFTPGRELCLFKFRDLTFAILICFDISFFETPSLAVKEGADLLISPTLIRREGLDNWRIYLRARALENRVPVIACNTLGEVKGAQYLGCSQIIQFYPGHTMPSKLKITTVEENLETIVPDQVDYKFPRQLRKERLAERIDIGTLTITRAHVSDE